MLTDYLPTNIAKTNYEFINRHLFFAVDTKGKCAYGIVKVKDLKR